MAEHGTQTTYHINISFPQEVDDRHCSVLSLEHNTKLEINWTSKPNIGNKAAVQSTDFANVLVSRHTSSVASFSPMPTTLGCKYNVHTVPATTNEAQYNIIVKSSRARLFEYSTPPWKFPILAPTNQSIVNATKCPPVPTIAAKSIGLDGFSSAVPVLCLGDDHDDFAFVGVSSRGGGYGI
jgi:hypothetical protein